jgi:hypothetical protein
VAYCSAYELAKNRSVELLRLAGPGDEDALCGESRHMVEKREFQSFTGDFAGDGEVGGTEPSFRPALENEHDQGVSIDLFERFALYGNLHHSRLCRNPGRIPILESVTLFAAYKQVAMSLFLQATVENPVVH